ncbi:hypothetical protein CCACVL1_22417 [Corchorus capsularis]|uniref:Uncharacterized protein n=1 Tax=Corchorus capsularis TaxID=210143 RepID=A0A1R3GYX7_COCAP|nr:hypothetical protein CCACVL1_22417 [Corchorus capsularis]
MAGEYMTTCRRDMEDEPSAVKGTRPKVFWMFSRAALLWIPLSHHIL